MGRIQLKFVDADKDTRQTSIPVQSALADGSNYAGQVTKAQNFRDAVAAVSLGALSDYGYVADEVNNDVSPPTNNFAQSTTNWTVQFSKTTDGTAAGIIGGTYTMSIPCANLALGVVRNGRVELDTGAGAGATLKAGFENLYFDEDGNQAIVEAIFHRED